MHNFYKSNEKYATVTQFSQTEGPIDLMACAKLSCLKCVIFLLFFVFLNLLFKYSWYCSFDGKVH